MLEEWKEMPRLTQLTDEQNDEWQAKYMVSNFGNVWSNKTKKALKPSPHRQGYHLLSTKLGGRNGLALCVRIHRMVAMQFIPNPDNKPEVNHIDGDKTNNCVSNLEWVTSAENTKHAIEVLGCRRRCSSGFDNPKKSLSRKEEAYIKQVYVPRCRDFGSRALARKFRVHHTTILKAVNR